MRRLVATAALLLSAAVLTPAASAALEGPQAEFRLRVEPICEANGRAAERIIGGPRLVGGRAGGGPDALEASGQRFVRASNALGRAVAKLRAVPQPESDGGRLSGWLGQVSDQARLLRRAGRAAIDGRAGRAQKLINRTANGSRRANAAVVSYEFRHCVLKAAGFTP